METCETCKYLINKNYMNIRCGLKPPIFIEKIISFGQVYETWLQPEVDLKGWCGQYEKHFDKTDDT